MLISLVAPPKLYHTKALPGAVISRAVAALLTFPDFQFAAPLAAIAPPARKSDGGKIPMAYEPKILPPILDGRISKGE